MNYW